MKTEDELTKLTAIMNQTEFKIDSEYKIPKVFNCPICGEKLELFNGNVFITKSNGDYYKGKVCTKCNYEVRFRIKEWMYRKINDIWGGKKMTMGGQNEIFNTIIIYRFNWL